MKVTWFGQLVGIGGFVEEISGVLEFGAKQTPTAEPLLCLALEILGPSQMIAHVFDYWNQSIDSLSFMQSSLIVPW